MSNLINKTFGYLTVISIDENPNNKRKKYICKCKCGNIKSILPHSLVSGHTTSCGCKKYESKNYTHKKRNTRLYSIWCDIKKRCTNPHSKSFNNYGGRGISICDEWYNFQSFYEWSLNNGYNDNLSIDRIDNNGNYCPNNCRWISHEEQQQNKSNTIRITYEGNTYSLSKWCRLLDVNFKCIYSRYMHLKNKRIEPTYEMLFGKESETLFSSNQPKKVYQYNKNGDLIKVWDSINSVASEGFNRIAVSQCCSGKTKTSAGFIWKTD